MQNKKRWISVGLLTVISLGSLLVPYLRSRDMASISGNLSQDSSPSALSGTNPIAAKSPIDQPGPLKLSPDFSRYAELTDFTEKTESLRTNLLASLQQIAQGLQIDEAVRQHIIQEIEDSLNDATTLRDLAKALDDQLTEDEIKALSELHENPVAVKVQSREEALMQQNSDIMVKFLEQHQDPEAYRIAQLDSKKIIEELQLWDDTERMFRSITNHLLSGLNQKGRTVSSELFQQTTAAMLENQRESLTITAMYLYQDLSDKELTEFKAIYKNPAAAKERQIVFDYFETIFAQIGSSMGRLVAQGSSAK